MNIINNSNSHFLAFCYVPGTSWEMSPTQCGPHTKCNGGGGGGCTIFIPMAKKDLEILGPLERMLPAWGLSARKGQS